jgi:dihydroorotate dehydrogenase electron transfer subunit
MKLEILANTLLKEKRYFLELKVPKEFPLCAPGQFLHMRIEDSCDPLLRRPFSIHDFNPAGKKGEGVIKIFYEVVGKGTALLSQKQSSSVVDVLGPCGHGFDLLKIEKAKKIYIVAGGMGMAPLYFLAKTLVHKKPVVLLGARTKDQLFAEPELKKLKLDVSISTEDGSEGTKGKITDVLSDLLKKDKTDGSTTICACGPKSMLAVVSELGRRYNIGVFVSMEEFMGCGLGACLGCVIRTVNGYKRICHDGPVFDSKELVW